MMLDSSSLSDGERRMAVSNALGQRGSKCVTAMMAWGTFCGCYFRAADDSGVTDGKRLSVLIPESQLVLPAALEDAQRLPEADFPEADFGSKTSQLAEPTRWSLNHRHRPSPKSALMEIARVLVWEIAADSGKSLVLRPEICHRKLSYSVLSED
jgi:hypothetical protein